MGVYMRFMRPGRVGEMSRVPGKSGRWWCQSQRQRDRPGVSDSILNMQP
ncbi:putative carbon starvation protein [Erwinia sp. Ejp617]|nr:putative carbon starvation protein [Erwinia sp. Ejp617]